MNYIVTKQLKNAGLAAFLTILFGGIGLFYASIWGGIIMTVLFPVAVFLLFFSGHFFGAIIFACSYYIICFAWAIVSVRLYNKKVQSNISPIQIHTSSQTIESTDLIKDNYYEQYWKAQKNDTTILWLILTVIVGILLFYGVYHYL
jgi:hypothetical protein